MSDLRFSSVAWLTSVLLIGGAACDDASQRDPGSRYQASQNAPAVAGSSAQGVGSGTGYAADAGLGTTAPLADPQIVSVLSTVNAGAIERSTIATQSAQAESVRALAQEVIDTRLAAQERLTRLVASTSFAAAVNVSDAENSISDMLLADSKRIVTQLQDADAASFDALFLQTQVQVLSRVLDVIDTKLLPTVESVLLRAEVERVRAESVVLLERTRALLAELDLDTDAHADGGVPDPDADAGF